MKSISQIARELGYSHTAISNVITKLESELSVAIGQPAPNGRARLISDEEYDLIKTRCPKKIPKGSSLVPQSANANTGFMIPATNQSRETIEAELIDEKERSANQLEAFKTQLTTFNQATQNAQASEDAELFADLERYKQKLLMARQMKEQMKAEILYGKVTG